MFTRILSTEEHHKGTALGWKGRLKHSWPSQEQIKDPCEHMRVGGFWWISLICDSKSLGISQGSENLDFSEKRIAKDIRKTISSAVANAENNFHYNIDKLIVKEAYCGKQLVMKRFRPRAKGRASPILKPYSNVTIILSETKKMESHGTKS